jgi:uncharacterized radical SAM protein YgiQ
MGSMSSIPALSLPHTMDECLLRGWDTVDIVLVTGDGYVDHPSFGVALIGRLLESQGYRVAILSQPRHDRPDDFRRFGKPRLFFGITAGNLDSIVANYTGNGKVRDVDSYSKDGNPWRSEEKSKANRRRPDRAAIVYANLARGAYKDVPIILGGVEASLRRFVHYDYKQNKLRGSVLTDGKADLLIYGMGEKAITAAAENLKTGKAISSIAGSCERLTDQQYNEFSNRNSPETYTILPSWQEIQKERSLFLDAELLIDRHARSYSSKILIQKQQSGWIVQHPSPQILTTAELDSLYSLPFTRKPYPTTANIPAYHMIRHSLTIVRGCSGNCSFCAITRHQGPTISSRSKGSVKKEVLAITKMDDFKGTISDLGGPTANLYGTSCAIGGCKKHDCLYPKVCKHLQVNETSMLDLLREAASVKGVKHVFISSGLRMELLLKTPKLLQKLISSHLPGSMKIAPEHTEEDVLRLMHKESHAMLHHFVKECRNIARQQKKEIRFTPYVITAHPGSTIKSAEALAKKMQELNLQVRHFQDFTPTPGTISTAMFVTGLDPEKKKKIHIAAQSEKSRQRSILEKYFHKPNYQKRTFKKKK